MCLASETKVLTSLNSILNYSRDTIPKHTYISLVPRPLSASFHLQRSGSLGTRLHIHHSVIHSIPMECMTLWLCVGGFRANYYKLGWSNNIITVQLQSIKMKHLDIFSLAFSLVIVTIVDTSEGRGSIEIQGDITSKFFHNNGCLYFVCATSIPFIMYFRLIIVGCITHFKVHAETGNVYAGSQYPYYGDNPILKIVLHNSATYDIELTGSKPQGSTYTKEFAFDPQSCVRREDIKEVQLKAGVNGNDGWYISSINTYTAAGNNRKYDLLTTDPGFTMWVDANEPHLYPYIATKHLLTKVVVSDCISYVKVEAKTGDEPYADVSGTNHLIVLKLEDDTGVQAEIEGPIN